MNEQITIFSVLIFVCISAHACMNSGDPRCIYVIVCNVIGTSSPLVTRNTWRSRQDYVKVWR